MSVAAAPPPQKRVLPESPASADASLKKRKVDPAAQPPQFKAPAKISSGPNSGAPQKSTFELEVLEKLGQGAKHKADTGDQKWERPNLGEWDARTTSLCFQQIEAEEGTLHGGKTTVRLFGVTEVGRL